MVVEPSLDNRPQPLAHLGYGRVHQAVQAEFTLLQLGPQALESRLTLDRKRPPPGLRALVRAAKEGERFWFAQPPLGSTFRRVAAELDQAGFLWMQLQAELGEALPQFLEAAFGIVAMLEPHDEIICVPDENDLAPCVVFSPVLSPQVEYLVEESIRQQR